MSAFATLNGQSVIDAVVSLPRDGAWHADVSVDTQKAMSGKCTLKLGGTSFACGVYRGGVTQDTFVARLVAGTGKFHTTAAPARSYRNAPVRLVLGDLLRLSGDQLSPRAEAPILNQALPQWSWREGPAGLALAQLMDAVRVPRWRFLHDGTLWVGSDAWPKASLREYDVLSEHPAQGKVVLHSTDFGLQPGTTLGRWRVSYVVHHLVRGEFRTEVWVE